MNKLMKNPIVLIVGGIGAGYLITRLYKWVKHESAEMKAESAIKSMVEESSSSMSGHNNYVDEGFMGFTASDEFFMLGGGSPIEFANANGHNVPVATDEPNFAYGDGSGIAIGIGGRDKKRLAMIKAQKLRRKGLVKPPTQKGTNNDMPDLPKGTSKSKGAPFGGSFWQKNNPFSNKPKTTFDPNRPPVTPPPTPKKQKG